VEVKVDGEMEEHNIQKIIVNPRSDEDKRAHRDEKKVFFLILKFIVSLWTYKIAEFASKELGREIYVRILVLC